MPWSDASCRSRREELPWGSAPLARVEVPAVDVAPARVEIVLEGILFEGQSQLHLLLSYSLGRDRTRNVEGRRPSFGRFPVQTEVLQILIQPVVKRRMGKFPSGFRENRPVDRSVTQIQSEHIVAAQLQVVEMNVGINGNTGITTPAPIESFYRYSIKDRRIGAYLRSEPNLAKIHLRNSKPRSARCDGPSGEGEEVARERFELSTSGL